MISPLISVASNIGSGKPMEPPTPGVPAATHGIPLVAAYIERLGRARADTSRLLQSLLTLEATTPVHTIAADAAAASLFLGCIRLWEAIEWFNEAIKQANDPSDAPSRAHHNAR